MCFSSHPQENVLYKLEVVAWLYLLYPLSAVTVAVSYQATTTTTKACAAINAEITASLNELGMEK